MDAEYIDKVMRMDIQAAYKLLASEAVDNEEVEEIKKLARRGILIRFDIYLYFENHYRIKPKGEAIIIGGLLIDIHDFWTEMEARESLIKRNLLALADDQDIIMPRSYEKPIEVQHE